MVVTSEALGTDVQSTKLERTADNQNHGPLIQNVGGDKNCESTSSCI